MAARALMLQGTGSDVGKSLLVAGLCRALVRRGLTVRPFKPQNMSNNAAVTPAGDAGDGGEIGRAQALQARACGVPPEPDMNPVLLKPESDMGSQIVVCGKVFGRAKARDYYALKPQLLPRVLESYERLRRAADIVLVEGAGSPAEVNLRAGDIANMGFATAAGCPVVLVADIERGGVLASLLGTVELLEPEERALLAGWIVNKFRGDKMLFDPALAIVAERTGLSCHGVVPWFPAAHRLPAEDAVALDRPAAVGESGPIKVAVPRLARIANFDDLDPLRAEPDVTVEIVPPGRALPGDAALVLLPGSKSTIADLAVFRAEGWDIDLAAHRRRGGLVLGLCAGFQMLGRRLSDPRGVEGPAGSVEGLGLLDVETEIGERKTLRQVSARETTTGEAVRGYEMHMGRTSGPGLDRPMLDLDGRADGAVSADGRAMGCYMHGLFAADGFRAAFLARLRPGRRAALAYEATVEQTLDALADHLEANLDIDALIAAAR